MPADHGTPNTGDERDREVEAVARAVSRKLNAWLYGVGLDTAERVDIASYEIAEAALEAAPSPARDGTVAVEDVGKRALEIAERLRDDPQQERWVIAAYEESAATIEGEPTPVCRVQGPSTSSQGVEVVPLGDLAWAIASAEFGVSERIHDQATKEEER